MILVTGGTGFVGSHLLYHLVVENNDVKAIYRTNSSLENVKKVFSYYTSDTSLFKKIIWLKADVTNVPDMIVAFEKVTQVYHCAAFISFNPKDYREMRKVNIYGTAIVANLAIDKKVEKLCYVSSIAAVGDAKTYVELITEECEWNKEIDNSGYSITKFGGEMEIWRASQEGVDVVIVNPGVILGKGFWHTGSSKLFSQVYNGFNFYTEGVTGFVAVTDVVKAMINLMKANIKNERFILVSENKSYKDVLLAIADGLCVKKPSKKIKPWQTAVFWRVAWILSKLTGKEPLLSKYSARSTHTISKYSSKKIQETLGLKFELLEKTIKSTAHQFLKEVS
ncbi:MAG: SDR family oxidoreductase [Flavobacteriaceae bacterium]|nr:SDR family oxidoreductase [Flavobacteriaceae bacterium]